jgi:predicted NAD/FAD-dependent oxidoreductase
VRTEGEAGSRQVHAGFDAVLLALPAPAAAACSPDCPAPRPWARPCPGQHRTVLDPDAGLPAGGPARPDHAGPQWNVARSTHHRIAWLARESSKPGRSLIERWTVQASDSWSEEHFDDTPERVQAKLQRAFVDITGIRAEPSHIALRRWPHAKTRQALGQTHLWDPASGIGLCGDWCLGHRVEDAFVSGLSLALSLS